ncbi:bifunctional response regulator/alkaline phosphatase family protein [Lishizhenia sp.]|uniref:T9SS response regulator signal transducer PorX n=1 Tax=Lishizhenia sp. TaxID=2497594 RepID=UPI00299DA52A|nr:bifunctional response regulator/alkaline phosphatase family protein [Lishizhenia sp.]MDX1445669.1 bifunctional response regulator/alkaline phosphatase family protein [Lishizhenia sp.]
MQTKILWADDEIELLKPHIMFLEQKGYDVQTVNNGDDAVEQCEEHNFDIVFLDENMPGISGLEALTRIKERNPMLPIVMITKSEEESIMEEAIGGKIADYLIKPVNPNQILLSLKKNLNQSKLVSQKTNANYQQEFRQIGMDLGDNLDKDEWTDIYKKLVYWELELDEAEDKSMEEILRMQKQEANEQFIRFIEDNYLEWLNGTEEAPEILHTLFKNRVVPEMDATTYLLVIDNLRYDQWQVLKPLFSKFFSIKEDDLVYSILPTATHYARNAFFAGLLPSEIAKKHPDLWKNEEDEGGKNMHEKELLAANLKRLGKNINFSYNKITNLEAGKKLNDNFHQLSNNDLNVIVYNFVDMLSHARTDMEVIRELADDESAYRSLTLSWFEHSPLFDIIKKIAQSKAKIVLTTDHGTVKVQNPVKIVGDKNVNTNLRYKTGKNLSYKAKDVFQVKDPQDAFLPKSNLSSEFVFAKGADFFVYPNNYNYFVNFYKNTFQHGGISLEEVLIPFVVMEAK